MTGTETLIFTGMVFTAIVLLAVALIVPTAGTAAQASRKMRRRIGRHLEALEPGTTSLLREQYLQDLSPLERWVETLPLVARMGETVGLGLPLDSVLVSTSDPGRSDASLCLPATVMGTSGGLELDVFGQRVTLARGGPHAVGARLWLSVLRVLPRPD